MILVGNKADLEAERQVVPGGIPLLYTCIYIYIYIYACVCLGVLDKCFRFFSWIFFINLLLFCALFAFLSSSSSSSSSLSLYLSLPLSVFRLSTPLIIAHGVFFTLSFPPFNRYRCKKARILPIRLKSRLWKQVPNNV